MFLVFPNPFTGLLRFELPSQMNGLNRIDLFDSQGARIAEKQWYGSLLEWELNALPCGIYFFKISTPFSQHGYGKVVKFSE